MKLPKRNDRMSQMANVVELSTMRPTRICNSASLKKKKKNSPGRTLEADLHLLVLKRGNLFNENCDGAQDLGNSLLL